MSRARPIDAALVDEVWREIVHYLPDRVQSEARAFLEQQPDVAAVAALASEPFDAPVQQATFGLAFLFFKVLERSLGEPFPRVAEERLQTAWQANAARLAESPESVASALVGHMLGVFYGGDSGAYDARVRASLVVMLETLTEAADVGTGR
ncbi:MAG: hypothetical protein ACREJV_08490 [Candidatus Rokuibacteriota bacterium]